MKLYRFKNYQKIILFHCKKKLFCKIKNYFQFQKIKKLFSGSLFFFFSKIFLSTIKLQNDICCSCQRNVANNCGINAKQMALELAQLGLTGDKMSIRYKKKVRNEFYSISIVIDNITGLISGRERN